MTNELVDQTAISNRLSQVTEVSEKIAADAGTREKRLKFKEGKFFVDADEIPAGREYIAHVTGLVWGWVRWDDGIAVDRRLGPAYAGFTMPPEEALGAGEWSKYYYLPLEDTDETGDLLVFESRSDGGRRTIATLCKIFAHNMRNGLPIIRLAVGSYHNKTHGKQISYPDFPVVGWTNAAPTPPLREELNDAIPF
jgi:hypothetical protein